MVGVGPRTRAAAARLLRRSGMLRLAAPLLRRVPRILMYHRFQAQPGGVWPSAELFERHIRYLADRCCVLSMSRLREAIVNDDVPANAVALTVDDGYEDFYTVAFPILRKYRVPATLYVTTDFVDGRMWFWWDAVSFLLDETPMPELTVPAMGEAARFDLRRSDERHAAWSAIGSICLALTASQREQFLSTLADDLHVRIPREPPPAYRPITWAQVGELAANGIEIGSHTCSHARLSFATSDELRHEVAWSKRRIEEATGRPISSFAYPFGRREDLSDGARRAVVEAGYSNAVVAYHDGHVTEDLFALRRFSVGVDDHALREILAGTEIALARLTERLGGAWLHGRQRSRFAVET